MRGFVLWEGTSNLDYTTPIVCLLTLNSKNEKTGDMAQTWILRQDRDPQDAVVDGSDAAICGNCVHRTGGTCYVHAWRGPRQVWKAWKEGKYRRILPHSGTLKAYLQFKGVRIGAYGDPAAVPLNIWTSVANNAAFVTGYTHHWRTFPAFAVYCMASVESAEERAEANQLGFRTYRVLKEGEERIKHKEAQCPASKEAGKKMTCVTCRYCNGHTGEKYLGDVAINQHGNRRISWKRMDMQSSPKTITVTSSPSPGTVTSQRGR